MPLAEFKDWPRFIKGGVLLCVEFKSICSKVIGPPSHNGGFFIGAVAREKRGESERGK